MTFNNVEDIVNSNKCMGCSVCEPVCPVQCITIGKSDSGGLTIPVVDQPACVSGCDVCLRVCPGDEVDFVKLSEKYLGAEPERSDVGSVRSSPVGYAADASIRHAASSGGALTAFLIYLLQADYIDGAIVLRMDPERPFDTQVVVATTPAEIAEAKGSKYCPGKSGVGLRYVMRNPGRYAFVGLSCHNQGVRKFQEVFRKYRSRIVITLGLFCGGGITHHGTEFLLGHLGTPPDELSKLTLRGDGWPGKTTAVRKDGEIRTLHKRAAARSAKEAATYNSWMHRYFSPPRCLTCNDLTAQLADVSFGDPWLPRFTTQHMRDGEGGLTMMVTRSEIGERLLNLAIRDGAICTIDEVSPQEVADSQGKLKRKTRLRPYRLAAKLAGVQMPEYHGLYLNEGSSSPLAVLRAYWEYKRLQLAHRRALWPALLWLETFLERQRQLRQRWRGRIRRLPAKLRRLVGR